MRLLMRMVITMVINESEGDADNNVINVDGNDDSFDDYVLLIIPSFFLFLSFIVINIVLS